MNGDARDWWTGERRLSLFLAAYFLAGVVFALLPKGVTSMIALELPIPMVGNAARVGFDPVRVRAYFCFMWLLIPAASTLWIVWSRRLPSRATFTFAPYPLLLRVLAAAILLVMALNGPTYSSLWTVLAIAAKGPVFLAIVGSALMVIALQMFLLAVFDSRR